jgi:multidrug efflux system membrane fusion protein
MKRVYLGAIVVGVVAAAAAGYYFYSQPRSSDAPAKMGKGGPGKGKAGNVPVVAAAAVSADVGVLLDGLGTVTPVATVTVRSRVDGQLMKLAFREGQVVSAGDLLAEIDPRPAQVQLATAEGQLARDQSLLKNAQTDLERYRVLLKQDSIARQQLDTQEALVRQYEATLKMDQAAIDSARLQLVYSRITAPIGGRLGLRQVDPGNMVRAGDANGLVVITQLQPIAVLFTIPEDDLPPVMQKLAAGESLQVDAYDRAGRRRIATGSLLTADNQIDQRTGMMRLKAIFPNDDDALFPNQFVNVRLLLDVRRGTVIVPAAAIQRGPQGTFAYAVGPDGTVAVRPLTVGPTEAGDAAIESGLSPDDVVVVDGVDKLRAGSTVQVRVPEAEASGPRPAP